MEAIYSPEILRPKYETVRYCNLEGFIILPLMYNEDERSPPFLYGLEMLGALPSRLVLKHSVTFLRFTIFTATSIKTVSPNTTKFRLLYRTTCLVLSQVFLRFTGGL